MTDRQIEKKKKLNFASDIALKPVGESRSNFNKN